MHTLLENNRTSAARQRIESVGLQLVFPEVMKFFYTFFLSVLFLHGVSNSDLTNIAWSPWSGCTTTCGNAVRMRSQLCPADKDCDISENYEIEKCPLKKCSENVSNEKEAAQVSDSEPFGHYGRWSQWSDWSECDCRTKQRTKKRRCEHDASTPVYIPCKGPKENTSTCIELQQCTEQESSSSKEDTGDVKITIKGNKKTVHTGSLPESSNGSTPDYFCQGSYCNNDYLRQKVKEYLQLLKNKEHNNNMKSKREAILSKIAKLRSFARRIHKRHHKQVLANIQMPDIKLVVDQASASHVDSLSSSSWSKWTPWTACSADCGDGHRVRSRHCTLAGGNPGIMCPGNDNEINVCTGPLRNCSTIVTQPPKNRGDEDGDSNSDSDDDSAGAVEISLQNGGQSNFAVGSIDHKVEQTKSSTMEKVLQLINSYRTGGQSNSGVSHTHTVHVDVNTIHDKNIGDDQKKYPDEVNQIMTILSDSSLDAEQMANKIGAIHKDEPVVTSDENVGDTDSCKWTTWSRWSRCSNRCGSGRKTRQRACRTDNGEQCVSYVGARRETIVCIKMHDDCNNHTDRKRHAPVQGYVPQVVFPSAPSSDILRIPQVRAVLATGLGVFALVLIVICMFILRSCVKRRKTKTIIQPRLPATQIEVSANQIESVQ